MKLLGLSVIMIYCTTPLAYAAQALNTQAEECYATSMIGYDYVINSRAGLPIEKALNTVSVDTDSNLIKDIYKFQLKNVVHGAYQWPHSPHTYAVKIMHACAFNQGVESTVIN